MSGPTEDELVQITDQSLHIAHLVRDAVPTEGGRMVGMCGRVFLPTALTTPLGRRCPLCDAVAHPGLPAPRTTWVRSIFARRHPTGRAEG